MSELRKNTKKEDSISSKEYEDLLDKYQFSAKELSPGKLLKGKVIKVTPSHVLVDVGSKSEGIIPLEEFGDTKDINALEPGSEIEAILEKSNLREGYLYLSRKRAIAQKALENLETAFLRNNWIVGKITNKIRNGFSVNVGIETFLPDSHADVRPVKDPEKMIGNIYKFKVIKFDRKSENAVLSRKLLLQDEREKRKKRVFDQLSRGKKIKGKIKSLTNFGAFVDLGGIEGLLHISDMSWGKINHPSEIFEANQDIEVVILDFDEKQEKISLGYKQLIPDPWLTIDTKYFTGQKITGKVVSLTDFGAFVELEPGVEGLVHVSDLTWSISLGIKQVSPHPLEVYKQTYSPGSRVKGTITSITDFGAFIEVEKGIEGLIHISDISWEKVKHPSDKLKVGDEIEAIILNIDVDKQKLSLGIKQLEGDIWEDFFERHKVGDLVNVKIVRLAGFGIFVEITPGIEGVVFLSELDDKKIEDPAEHFSLGEEKLAKIIKLSQKEKKISLSLRQAQFELQKLEYQKYVSSQDGRHTLGDIMKDQLKTISTSKKTTKTKKKTKEEKDDKS
jgi:small subunit ribosomal protein S1